MKRVDPVEKASYWLRRNLSEVPAGRRSEILRLLGDVASDLVACEYAGKEPRGESEARRFGEEWFRHSIGSLRKQSFAGILFDGRWRCLARKVFGECSSVACTIVPRQLAEWTFVHPATVLFLAHNHPSGNPVPSLGDGNVDRRVKMAFEPFQVAVETYVVVPDKVVKV